MQEMQRIASLVNASAMVLVGTFLLFRGEGETSRDAIKKCNKKDGQTFNVLGVVVKLMDGTTFSMAQEIKQTDSNSESLDEPVWFDEEDFLQIQIKPWGN